MARMMAVRAAATARAERLRNMRAAELVLRANTVNARIRVPTMHRALPPLGLPTHVAATAASATTLSMPARGRDCCHVDAQALPGLRAQHDNLTADGCYCNAVMMPAFITARAATLYMCLASSIAFSTRTDAQQVYTYLSPHGLHALSTLSVW